MVSPSFTPSGLRASVRASKVYRNAHNVDRTCHKYMRREQFPARLHAFLQEPPPDPLGNIQAYGVWLGTLDALLERGYALGYAIGVIESVQQHGVAVTPVAPYQDNAQLTRLRDRNYEIGDPLLLDRATLVAHRVENRTPRSSMPLPGWLLNHVS